MKNPSELSKFTITISDGFVKYEYKMDIRSSYSISAIATKIFKLFKLGIPIGKRAK